MAFVAIPLVISSLGGLSYYFYGNSEKKDSENKEEIPDAPVLEVMEKYSTVMIQLKTESHPILQKLDFAPTLNEIQITKANLKPVEQNIKTDKTLMEIFVMALKKRRDNLNKIN
jgi:hypothetical protein